ncbi:MAG: hypothetical protein KJO07_23840 [Deltaproteobacteria bacterium]|nr:hypothetical protein [Deltaproteobacteria bacterium]
MIRRPVSFLLAVAVSLVFAACGDDGGGGGGADAGDAVDSGPVPDASPTASTCGLQLAYRDAARRAGAPVIFSTPDGTILSTQVTDVDGVANFDQCVPGTLLTFDLAATAGGGPGGLRYLELRTIAGVNPGDTVIFDPRPSAFDATASVNVSADSAGLIPNGGALRTGNGCGSQFGSGIVGNNYQLGIDEDCLGTDQTIDVAALLLQDNTLVGFSAATGVAVTDGQTSNVDLPAFTNVAADADLTITVTNPLPADSVNASALFGRDLVGFWSFQDDVSFAAGTGTAVVDRLPPSFATYQDLDTVAQVFLGPDRFAESSYEVRSAPGTTATVDMSAMLPLVRGGSVVFEDDKLVVEWQSDGSMASADGGAVRFSFNDGQLFGAWLILFPPGDESRYVVSSVPKSLGIGDAATFLGRIAFFEYDYTDYRGVLTTGVTDQTSSLFEGADSTDLERVRRTSYYENDD